MSAKLIPGSRVPMTKDEAQEVTDDIRRRIHAAADNLDAMVPLVREAWLRKAHTALGFETWHAYARTTFAGDLGRLRQFDRGPISILLSREGMSNRAIAATLGVDPKTVRDDLASGGESSPPGADDGHVTGADGKKYARHGRRGRLAPSDYATEVTRVEKALKQLGGAMSRLRKTADTDPDAFSAHAEELFRSQRPRLEVIYVNYLSAVKTLEWLAQVAAGEARPTKTTGADPRPTPDKSDDHNHGGVDDPAAANRRGER